MDHGEEQTFYKLVRVETDTDGQRHYVSRYGDYKTEWNLGAESESFDPSYVTAGCDPLCSKAMLHASEHPMGTWPFVTMLDPPETWICRGVEPSILLYSLHTVTVPDRFSIHRHRVHSNLPMEDKWKVGAQRMTFGKPVTGIFRIADALVLSSRMPFYFSVLDGLLHSHSVGHLIKNPDDVTEIPLVPDTPLLPTTLDFGTSDDWLLPAIVLSHGALWCHQGRPVHFLFAGYYASQEYLDAILEPVILIDRWAGDNDPVPLLHRKTFALMIQENQENAFQLRSFLAALAFDRVTLSDGRASWRSTIFRAIQKYCPGEKNIHQLWRQLVPPMGPISEKLAFDVLYDLYQQWESPIPRLLSLEFWLVLFGQTVDIEAESAEMPRRLLLSCLKDHEDDALPSAAYLEKASDSVLRKLFSIRPLNEYRTMEEMMRRVPSRAQEYSVILSRLPAE